MSARLLRPRIQARPDNEMAARSRRLHHRMQMPYWLRDRHVEVKPHIYDRTVERRVNTLVHPNRRRLGRQPLGYHHTIGCCQQKHRYKQQI